MQFYLPELIEDPYPFYATWRRDQPIWRDADTGMWILTRHDDVRAILKDSAHYSSQAMGSQGQTMPLPLLTDDPPRHTQLRGLVNKAFTNRMLKAIEGRVEEIAESLVAKIPDGESVDIIPALTTPLPVEVISQMMGIPFERGEDFKRWSDALTGTLAGASDEERMTHIMEMAAFFQGLIPQRREQPGEDLVSVVANAEIDGERLTDQDIIGFWILLLIAGNETTTNLLSNFLNILVERPEAYEQLRAEPKLIDAGIEESLRFDGPVQLLMRHVTRDVTFHEQLIKAGEIVQVVMALPTVMNQPMKAQMNSVWIASATTIILLASASTFVLAHPWLV